MVFEGPEKSGETQDIAQPAINFDEGASEDFSRTRRTKILEAQHDALSNRYQEVSASLLSEMQLPEHDVLDVRFNWNHRELMTAFLHAQTNETSFLDPDRPDDGLFLPVDSEIYPPGTKFTVDFAGNESFEMGIGAGHVLPPQVSEITVSSYDENTGDFGSVRSGTREIRNGTIGYYDEAGYIPIFSKDVIEIKKVVDPKDVADVFNREYELKKADVERAAMVKEEMEVVRSEYAEELRGFRQQMDDAMPPDTDTPGETMRKDFLEAARAYAFVIEQRYGIPWQVTVAQAALESGFGGSGLSRRDFNFFGIHAWSGHGGETRSWNDWELDQNGKKVTKQFGFCRYDSMKDSFIGYGEFLTHNKRYRPVIEAFSENRDMAPGEFLQGIVDAGYAVDPDYVQKARATVAPYGIIL